MNTKLTSRMPVILALAFLATLNSQLSTVCAQGTAFTYQGRVQDNGSPANGNYDFTFALFNTNSTNTGQVGSTLTDTNVGVTNGLFTVPLDFGNQFPGAKRWLAIGVRTNGGSGFTALNPLQELTPTPYAIYATNAGTAANLTGTVSLAQLPAPVVTNGASGVNLTGSFTGNGGGLTNLNGAQLTSGSVPDSLLSNNVALLNRTPQNFTGTNTFAANIGIGTSTPEFPLDLAATIGDKLSLYSEAGGNGYGFGITNGLLQIHSDQSGSDVAIGYGPSTNFTERMRVQGNGNVGIGTPAPAATLEVNGTALIESNATYNGGIRLFDAQGYGFSQSSYGPFSIDANSNPGGRFTVLTNGNVGIGTASPSNTLDVQGSADFTGNVGIGTSTPGAPLNVARTGGILVGSAATGETSLSISLSSASGGYAQMQEIASQGTSYGNLVLEPQGGLVGIGTAFPSHASLEVGSTRGSTTITGGSGGAYYFEQGDGTFFIQEAQSTYSESPSIYAAGDIVTEASFISISDQRIKHIIGRSNPATDLATLLGIEVTDYTYIDTIAKGNRPHKKVIAQQVEKVFPQAVSQSTNEVPDIYKRAKIQDGWVQLATDLKVGERVKLIGEKEQGIYPVLEVRDGAFRTDFKPKTDKVFVFGREVNDFRTVDYDAIAMLNVSATQELAKKLAAKDEEIAKLQAQVSQLEQKAARAEALTQKLDDLQKQVAQLAAESRSARLAAGSVPQPSTVTAGRPALTTASLQN